MNKVNGFLYGLLSSASFGLIPLFTIPAMQAGMQFESILFYRFLFACMALGGILLINGQSFRISRRDIPSLLLLAILYLMSAVFLFWGYKFMASGVATTIHFMYPVLTYPGHDAILQRKKVRLADSRHRLCRDRCLLLIRWNTETGKFLIFRPFHRSFISIGICTVPCHNEPVKDRPDERITAHFLCLSFSEESFSLSEPAVSAIFSLSENGILPEI